MDAKGQRNHLKAYGVVYAAMKEGIPVEWLLNYKGGSFVMENIGGIADLCTQANVSYSDISDREYDKIIKIIKAPSYNGAVVILETPPKIAVYTPLNKEPWDDAVTLALTYAGIPFDKLYANEVLAGDLSKYDWLHLHHEDFTGEYSKFWANLRNTPWYQDDQRTMEALAARHGYEKVSQLQLAVVKKIRSFVNAGGNLFAMCTATETFDIALAADGVDICDDPFDGDPADPRANEKLKFEKCLAFKNFQVVTDPYMPVHSNIDFANVEVPEAYDYFTLIPTSAKKDPLSAMLCQDHVSTIKGFMGQTTAFRSNLLKPGVLVLGKNMAVKPGTYPYSEYNSKRVKYIHGTLGRGSWTFYGGHDPESYKHMVGSSPTDLSQFPNSPGYRLILNNLLLPAAKKALAKTNPVKIAKPAEEPQPVPAPSKIKLYPDADHNELVVSFEQISAGNEAAERVGLGNIVITDAFGKEVLRQSYDTQKAVIDLKGFAPGMYQVTVNGVNAGKIVKE
jgi:hypothetical protein